MLDRSLVLYQQAAALAPQDKAIRAGLAEDTVIHFIGWRAGLLVDLEGLRGAAVRGNIIDIEVPPYAELHEVMKEGAQQRIMIRDFNEARSKLKAKMDRDLPSILAVLEQGRKLDPQNAYYDYLEAELHFWCDRDAEGLARAKDGSGKPQLNYYHREVKQAVQRVLKETTPRA